MAGLLAADYNLQAISGARPASSLIALSFVSLWIVLIILRRYIDDHMDGWIMHAARSLLLSGVVYLQLQVRMSCESGTVVRLMCLACGFRASYFYESLRPAFQSLFDLIIGEGRHIWIIGEKYLYSLLHWTFSMFGVLQAIGI